MRRLLLASAAIAPLCAGVWTPARAETVISNERTTPIATSTANNGAADDVRIASGGALRPPSGPAVTLDSNDDVTNEGTIEIKNSDNAVGILIQGGRAGTVLTRGTISIIEDYASADADNDGDADGPFAQGVGRYGIRLTGASPFTGSITSEAAGRITVEGNDSFGVSIESPVTGNISILGATSVLGDRARGLSITAPITGNVTAGFISATGVGAVGVDVAGAISGRLVLNNTVNASGYRFATRPLDVSKLDADDLLQGGPALRVSADVAGGVVIDAPPRDRDPADTDEDDDGVTDTAETIGAMRSFGAAPAILIAAPDRDITIGAAGTNEASLLVAGLVSAAGVYDGVTATGVQLGGGGSGATRLTGGVRISGTVDALAAKADATGLRLAAGSVTPTITLEGVLSAGTTGGAGSARALLIEQGASSATFRNSGRMQAVVTGATGDAVAVEDRAGTLTLVENSGIIAAGRTSVPSGATVTGRAIALNLSANTSGVTVRQTGRTDGDDGGDNVTDPDADGDGVDDADEPTMIGEILLGSGADAMEVLNGTVNGAVSFGAGADRLLIDGTGRLSGSVTDSDGLLTVEVRRGTLELTNAQPLQLTSLNIAADGALIISVNPENTGAAALQVSGIADFADGAELGVRLTSLIQGPQQFTLLQAGDLRAPGADDLLLDDTPFLFVTSLTVDEPAGRLLLDVRRRTAAEAGLNQAETGAFDAVYQALGQDQQLRSAFLAQNTQEGFASLYEQMLPEHSGGALYSLAAGSRALSNALLERHPEDTGGGRGGWIQEVGFRTERDRGDDAGFEGGGFAVMGGVDTSALGGLVGVSAAFASSEFEEGRVVATESTSVTTLEAGLYWRGGFGRLTTSARGAVGLASFESERQLLLGGLERVSVADWNGVTGTGHLGVGYEFGLGRFHVRPEASLDAFFLREGEHDETGGGAGFDVAVDERNSHIVSGSTLVNFGARVGGFASELSVGYRQTLSGGAGDTTARFGSGTPFTITPADAPGGAAVVGLSLSAGSEWSYFSVQARGEAGDDYLGAELRFNLRFLF